MIIVLVQECMKLFNINVWICSDFLNEDFFLFLPNLFILYKEMNNMFYVQYSVYKKFCEAIFIWIIKNYNGKIVIVTLYCVVNLLLRQYLMCHF